MPVYSYKCTSCGVPFDCVSTVANRGEHKHCSCGGIASRNIAHEFSGGSNVDALNVDRERWSWSMGVHLSQIPEMVKAYPGSEYHPKTGQLKVGSRQDKIRKMKQRQLTEF